MSERDDDFLARWSRRKAGSRDGGLQKTQDAPVHKPGRMRTDPPAARVTEEVVEAEADGQTPLLQEASLQEEQPLAPIEQLTEADPPIEEPIKPADFDDFDFDKLNYASDYTQFLKEDVPEAVKRRALRMLWGSNPILANLDGLNDYDEDFTDAALAVKVLSSNYKPGSGYLTEEELQASYSEEARKAGPQPVEDEAEESDPEDLDVEDMDEDGDTPDGIQTASAEGESGDDGGDEKPAEKNEPA